MQEIIKIYKSKGGKEIVSAKDLYEILGLSSKHWAAWSLKNIERCIDNLENKEWVRIKDILSVAHSSELEKIKLSEKLNKDNRKPFLETTDYAITIQFAKRLAMQTRSPKRKEVQDYFLRCEEMAKAVLLPAIRLTSVEMHANMQRPMQVTNSKNVAAKLYIENNYQPQQIMEHHRRNCEQVTGFLPNQIKKKYNVKSGSALEVLRKQAPHLAATCSMNNYLVFEKGADLSQLKELDKALNSAYLEFTKLGFQLVD